MKHRLLTIIGSLAVFLSFAKPAFAGNLTSLTITAPTGTGVSNIGTLIQAVFITAVVIAVLFVFFMILLGGYGWITAGGDKAKVEEARTRITNALIGLAIVASAFAIIALVANFFGVDFTNISIPTATGS